MRTTQFLRSGNFEIPDLIGADNGGPGELTPWSVQESMKSNFERILVGLRNNAAKGRVVSGGDIIVSGSADSVTIAPMLAITKGNKAIWTQKAMTISLSGSEDSYEIWAKFSMADVPSSALYSKLAKPAGSYSYNNVQLVTDELAAGNPDANGSDIFQVDEPSQDSVYIGTIDTDPVVSIELNPDRGFPVTNQNGYQIISKIFNDHIIAEELSANIATINAATITEELAIPATGLTVDGATPFSGTFTFTEDGGTPRNLIFVNGICTQTT